MTVAAIFKKDWFGLLIVVLLSGLVIAAVKPAFLSPFNLYVLMVSTSYMLIIALAQMIIIAIGQMNLSVGAIGGLVAISFSGLMEVYQIWYSMWVSEWLYHSEVWHLGIHNHIGYFVYI